MDEQMQAQLQELMEQKIMQHSHYIVENGTDMPEVLNWTWQD